VPPIETKPQTSDDTLAEVVRDHQVAIWRYLGALGCSASDAEELAVETFVVAYQRGFEPRSRAATATFLRRIARNLWLRRRRAVQQDAVRFAEVVEELWQRDCGDGGNELVDALRACVSELHGRAAQAVQLCYFEELPHERAAAQLGLKPNGLKTMLQRLRASLRQCVERRTS